MTDALLYEERVTSAWTEALFAGLTVLFWALLVWRVSAHGFGLPGAVLLLLAVVFLFYALNYRTLEIRVTARSLRLKFGIFTKTIDVANIASCAHDDVPPLMRYGGAGIHFMFVRGRYRASYNFLEHPRVVVVLRRAEGPVKDVSFSTGRPEEVVLQLQAIGS